MSKNISHQTNYSLQALRFVFVMLIFMSHFNYRVTTPFDAGGDCGVAFFFLLSGFVLSMCYGSSISEGSFSFKRYIKRRLLKIYPLHLLCLVVFLIIFRPEIDHRLPLNALLLQSWIPDDNYYFYYNGVSWFLSSILFSYLLFPFAYRFANRRTLAVVLACYVVVYVIVPYNQINALLYVFPPVRFVDFFLGIVLYKLYSSRKHNSLPSCTEPLLVVLLILVLAVYPYTDEKLRNAPIYWIVLIPFIYVFTQQKGIVSHCLQCSLFQWLGSLSMPIFMLHPMVIRSMIHFFPSISYALMLSLCIIITIFLSWMTNRLFLRYIPMQVTS